MMKKAIAWSCFAVLVIAASCSKSNEDKLAPQTPVTTCDTASVSFSAGVVPILQANCYSCHGNGGTEGGVNLDTYNNVKDEAEDGNLLGTITHASGYPPMPQGAPQLSDCEINTIKAWIYQGTLNN